MKNLLRAFPETPEYVASAIRAGMAKARRREVWRRRAYAAASVAAVFAVLIGGLTLALNRGRFAGSGAPRDIRGPLSPGLALSARPDPAATPMPTPMPTELPTVYPTPMVSAPPSATLEPLESAEWESAAGNVEEAHAQSALAPTEVAQLYYYSTRGGQFYHADPGCTGMVGASLRPIDECQALGQAACPVCLEIDEDDPYFFSTLGGTHYHVEAHCSGMIGALARPKSEVEKLGQSPCPVCIGVGSMWVRGAWWDGRIC